MKIFIPKDIEKESGKWRSSLKMAHKQSKLFIRKCSVPGTENDK